MYVGMAAPLTAGVVQCTTSYSGMACRCMASMMSAKENMATRMFGGTAQRSLTTSHFRCVCSSVARDEAERWLDGGCLAADAALLLVVRVLVRLACVSQVANCPTVVMLSFLGLPV